MFRSKHQMQILREVARWERVGVLVTEQVGTAKTIHPAPELPNGLVMRQLLAYAGGVIPMLERAFVTARRSMKSSSSARGQRDTAARREHRPTTSTSPSSLRR
ncbi:MAG: hypothetical protein ABI706_12475 [Ilumatobacteraceae bacterium]